MLKEEFDILSSIDRDEYEESKDDNKVLDRMISNGYIQKIDKNYVVSTEGYKALEPYKVKKAIILAAGLGSRMKPITINTPKPLVRVNGKRIIEGLLDAIISAGIEEVYIVRGYLKEEFDVLKYKYPNIRFIDNDNYDKANNILSAYIVRDMLSNSYVMEADLLLSNPKLIRKYEYESNYTGRYTDFTDDWCFETDSDLVIKKINVSGHYCYHMYGISYWNYEDGQKMRDSIKKVYEMDGGKDKYWDEVALRYCIDDYKIHVRECYDGDVVEIDSYKELQEIDKEYR